LQKWVIFDFDGTLADSFEIQKHALQTLAARHGWPMVADEEVANLREKSLKEILKSRRIPFWRVPFLMQDGRKIIADQWRSVKIFPGIHGMLSALQKEGYQLGVLTSNTQEVVETVLQNASVRSHFSFIVTEPNLWGKDKRLKQLISVHDWNPQRI
jgi:phosphoglycolate phosphatase